MKIICPQCNKKGCHETTNASIIKHLYSRLCDKKIIGWMEIRCDKCRYLADSWEASEIRDEDFEELGIEKGELA